MMGLNSLKQHITNALGKKVNRNILIIESDDWGSIRMPSCKTYRTLANKGLAIDDCYNRYDSLATEDDLSALFGVLSSFKDQNGNHPAITANCLVANPDFERIRKAVFQEYFFEPFTETLKRQPGCSRSFSLWQEGMRHGIFFPQFHGREHINVPLWLTSLQKKDPDTLTAFNHCCWGHYIRNRKTRHRYYLAAYDSLCPDEEKYMCDAVQEGMDLFEKTFGYPSISFIAPNFIWSKKIEEALSCEGCSLIQSQRIQKIPVAQGSTYRKKYHYSGQKNQYGQRYVVRNASFEPSFCPNSNWVGSCLKDISRAFHWNTPAVITSHRVNYIGSISTDNRNNNLILLKSLLKGIQDKWPDVEFATTDQLAAFFLSSTE